MNKTLEQINKLKKELTEWGYQYYTLDNPTVSDAQYDGSMELLKQLEAENPELVTKDSPTQKVGGYVLDKFTKVEHKIPMLSLSNAFNSEDLIKFDDQIKRELHHQGEIGYVCELKIDGLSISLHYKDGFLEKAVTRGNGLVGEDVTHNVKTIKSIPLSINYKNDLEIRGEVFMPDNVFEELNKQGFNFANPRNAASGTLRQLDSKIAASRNLDAFLYMVPNPLEHDLNTHNEVLNFLAKKRFKTNKETRFAKNIMEVIKLVEELTNKRDALGYEVDGIVIKVDDNRLHEDIGYTAKAPKYMIAYKFPEEIATTTLEDIFPTVGRTGRITYNAKLSPVRLAGTVVAAATLHNADYVRELMLDVGDVVKVKKAGEIIPKVVGVVGTKETQMWSEEKDCPICNHPLHRVLGEVDQYCINLECPAILKASIQHFVSRTAMDIEGFGDKIVEKLIEEKIINSIISIYSIKYEDLINLEGFQEKSVTKLLESIEKSKTQDLDRFIFGLGIRHVGSKYAKILAKRFGTFENIANATEEQLIQIREIGPKVQENVIEYFKENQQIIEEFCKVGVKPKELAGAESNILEGKTFVITGSLTKPRKHFKDLIESNGGNVSSAISSRTDYLLAGEKAGSKLTKANSLGVKVLNEEELIEKLKGE
ncbi:NAD-dependent DNA ligase LigA [Mycoplasma todarodis]|uniref:DNA ligase n=1 Tax=Mycoplasma todarodis TaxID=1937191 RepID=A0A4R0XUP0_9MOLU|nr:NAD-dependent DNA ligase LigA [Mycoplasma todarodis]TCG11409.1 DNA ligase [Mycoplasma todarodis]